MPSKEHILEIYKVEAEKYNKTRDIQWKMNISIWSIVAASIYIVSAREIGKPIIFDSFSELEKWKGCGIVLIVHLAFLIIIQISLNRSLQRMHTIADLMINPSAIAPAQWKDFEKGIPLLTGFLWITLQILVTVVLLYIFKMGA